MIEDGHVAQSFHEARERGVLFDVGHGQGSFRWTVAERAAAEGFVPDIISSDMHVGGVNGIVYDQPTCLTKFLAMGMPLPDVIRASTRHTRRGAQPARFSWATAGIAGGRSGGGHCRVRSGECRRVARGHVRNSSLALFAALALG